MIDYDKVKNNVLKIRDMEDAVEDVRNGLSINQAAKKNGVCKTTLISVLKDKEIHDLKREIEANRSYSKVDATLFLYDLHIPHEDRIALNCAMDFARENYHIKSVVLGGDIMDCESLSKYDKTKDTASFSDEIEKTKELLDTIRYTFRKANDIVYIIGNHEERLEKYIAKHAPELQGVADSLETLLEFDEFGVELVDNRRMKSLTGTFYSICGFTVLHGHEMGICPIVSPAHRFLEKAKSNLILGHIHYPDEKILTTIDGSILRCYTVGTLGDLNPLYKPFNTWGHGFAIMEHRRSNVIVRNFRIINGNVY